MCDDEIWFDKEKSGMDKEIDLVFNTDTMVFEIGEEHHLVCPVCGKGDELHLIEVVQITRRLGEVTTNHSEYLDPDWNSADNFKEKGVTCHYCGFISGPEWKKSLAKGEVVK